MGARGQQSERLRVCVCAERCRDFSQTTAATTEFRSTRENTGCNSLEASLRVGGGVKVDRVAEEPWVDEKK